jgi:IS605 OrfB family transposase
MLHVASKRLVIFADSVGAKTIVLENLTGFKRSYGRENKKQHHQQRARNNRWPYAMLEFFVNYKAAAKGILLEHVPARNTSRGCPRCGHISKSNRNGLRFRCEVCNHADNADRVGATNVALKLLLQRQAAEERAAINRLKVAGSLNQLQTHPSLAGG